MCNPASFVLTAQKAFWLKTSDGHEDIIAEFNLGELDRQFHCGVLRCEITPPNETDFNTPLAEWKFKVDQDILPDWYDSIKDEERARIALIEWFAQKVVISGKREVRDGILYASGSAIIEAHGLSTVEARGSAIIKASSSATVRAYDSVTVRAYDSVTVKAYGSAIVKAFSSATIEVHNAATVEAHNLATVKAYGLSTVEARGSAIIEAHDCATVTAINSTTVKAYGSAIVEAHDSATIEAHDSATIIKWYDTVKVQLSGNAVCVDRSHNKPICIIAE